MRELLIATLATVLGGGGTFYIINYLTHRGDRKVIRYRDIVRLIHRSTGQALHSHNLSYSHPGTSGQQQITCYAGADSNDYWIIKAPHGHGELNKKGMPIQDGAIVRLEHRNTRRNLHSHPGTESPVTKQQEVTGYGMDGVGDTNDNWRVSLQNDREWKFGTPVRLIHVNTGAALHSHPTAPEEYTAYQQEVTGYSDRDENDLWIAVRTFDVE